MLGFSIWNTNMVLEAKALSRATPIVTSCGAPCRLTMPIVKGRHACDTLPDTFNIGEFKSDKRIKTIKHIYNESANII